MEGKFRVRGGKALPRFFKLSLNNALIMDKNAANITKLNGDGPIMHGVQWDDFYAPRRNHIRRMNHLLNQPMGLLLEDDPRKLIDKRAKGIPLTDMEAEYLADCMVTDFELAEEYQLNVELAQMLAPKPIVRAQ